MLHDGVRAVIEKGSYPMLPIFPMMQKKGNIEEEMMYNTFNMGLGMVLAVAAEDADAVICAAEAAGDHAYKVGKIVAGEKGVDLR